MELSFVYGVGSHATTKEYGFWNTNFLNPLQKQISLSIPLITSITVRATMKERKKNLFSIYVGKEIALDAQSKYYIEKYDLDKEELARFKQRGYERVCLLNFKKYDLILIGLKKLNKKLKITFKLNSYLLLLLIANSNDK